MENRVLTIHLPVDVAERVDSAAKKNGRSRAWIAREAIYDWLALEEERHQMILRALEDVDHDAVVSHAEMLAWAQEQSSRKTAC